MLKNPCLHHYDLLRPIYAWTRALFQNEKPILQREGLRWGEFQGSESRSHSTPGQRGINYLSLWVDEEAYRAFLVLGEKLGLKRERDGPYLALRG